MLTIVSGENFILNWVEDEKSFITSGPGLPNFLVFLVIFKVVLLQVGLMYIQNAWIRQAFNYKPAGHLYSKLTRPPLPWMFTYTS